MDILQLSFNTISGEWRGGRGQALPLKKKAFQTRTLLGKEKGKYPSLSYPVLCYICSEEKYPSLSYPVLYDICTNHLKEYSNLLPSNTRKTVNITPIKIPTENGSNNWQSSNALYKVKKKSIYFWG